MSKKIKVRLVKRGVTNVKLKPKNGIKVKDDTTYLYDPTLIADFVDLAEDWATKTDGMVEEDGEPVDYSAKAYAIGGTGTQTNNSKYYSEQAAISETNAGNSATSASGSASAASSSAALAKDWATKTDGKVDGNDYSAKYYAQQITPIASDITTVAGIASNVTTVAGISSDVTSLAGNSTNINKVASDINRVNLVADDIDSVHTVAVDISTVIDVANNKTNIDTVAGNSSNINAVVANESNINAVAGNESNINAVNSNKTNIDTVAGIASDVTAVADNETNINAVADNETNINAVNANKTNIDAVAGNETNINAVVSNSSNINAVAGNATNINAVASNSTNINAVASDLTNIDAVANDLTNIDNASTYANNANIWAEGTDIQVAALGGEKSSKGWAARAKELVDSIGSVLHYKGSVATRADLPITGQVLGDMYNITSDGSNVVWNGSDWDDISGIVDLSAYRTASDQDTIDAGKVPTSRTVNGKALSSDISLTASDVGAVSDAKINNTSIVTSGVANIPVASNGGTWGVVKVNSNKGITESSGQIEVIKANNTELSSKTNNYRPVVPSNLDNAVMEGLGNNSLTWSDTYKNSARNTIGAVASVNNTSPDGNGNVSLTIPTVNDATLTIQKNGTSVATFTANSSTNATANITVPTDTGDLTNGAGFITGITSSDVTTALGYTPYDDSNPDGYITGITSGDVTTALGYTPYNSSNPNGYQANVIETVKVNGTALTPSGKAVDVTVPTNNNQLTNGAGYITSSALSGYATETWVGQQGYLTSTALSGYATETWVGQQGYITGITSGDVTTALGYTPYDASNPNGYTSNVGTVTSVNNVSPVSGNVTLSIPTVNDSTITITQGGVTKGSFTLNQSSAGTIALDAGGGSVDIDGLSITKNGDDEIQTVGVIDQNATTTAIKTWTGTKAQYDAIVSKDANTLYNITDDTTLSDFANTDLSNLSQAGLDVIGADTIVAYQTPNSGNNYTWYRKYKSGWVEQGGIVTISLAATNNTYAWNSPAFPVTMSNTNYTYSSTPKTGWVMDVSGGIESVTTTAVSGYYKTSGGTTPRDVTIAWKVEGMSA